MRRGAVLATASLAMLFSLALGTSAVALREPAGGGHPQAAVSEPRPPVVAGQRLGTVPVRVPTPVAGVLDDGTGPTSPRREPSPSGSSAPRPDCAVAACVALTFDDGPGPDTDRLLGELAAKDVKVTFFVVGREIAKHPGVAARELAAGHVVGNHTFDHAALPGLSPEAVAAELDRTTQALLAEGVPAPILARPPYGSTSPEVAQTLAARGMVGVLWDVDTEDWKNRDAVVTTQRALDAAHPGAIILMHDIRPSTVDAVPGLVDALRARGFTLVTVPDLLAAPVAGHLYTHR